MNRSVAEARAAQKPLAVVVSDEDMGGNIIAEGGGGAVVSAVDDAASAAGVRPGMRVSEAMARSASLSFAQVSPHEIVAVLGVVAEVAMSFGAIVEVDGWGTRCSPGVGSPGVGSPGVGGPGVASTLDTAWVDITGAAHLFGGESALRDELESRVRALGYRADVAIADGPFFAQALARFAGMHADVPRIAAPGEGKRAIERLPVAALGLGMDCVAFFARLGVLSLSDMMKIDRAQLTARITGFVHPPRQVNEVLGWLEGKDPRPLIAYEPPDVLVDQVSFEDGVETAPQLVFAIRGMVSRLSARLLGRRQAANRIDIVIHYDRTMFRLRSGEADNTIESFGGSVAAEANVALWFDLPAPLSHTDDVFRAVKAKVEGLVLAAPAVRIELSLSRIVRAPEIQLDLSRDVSVSPDALPALLSELAAEIGSERVGVLHVGDDHRPERRSLLLGIHEAAPRSESKKKQLPLFAREGLDPPEPTRVLPEPISLACTVEGGRRAAAFTTGSTLFVGREAFVVEAIEFDRRLDSVAWWTRKSASRDYLRVTMSHGHGQSAKQSHKGRESSAQAWVFVDRRSGEVFLQGWWE